MAGGRRPATIGVMARAPIPGHCKTRLAAHIGDEHAAGLCRAMLLDTLANIETVAPSRGFRLVVMAAPENEGLGALRALAPERWDVVVQEGPGLGERLKNALRSLGVEDHPIALVDADSPMAPWSALVAKLEAPHPAGQVWMGPCEDGGYWMIGGHALSELGFLDQITWSTSAVARETRERCRGLGLALDELGSAYDVDEPSDLARLRADLARSPEGAPRTAALLRAWP